MRVLLATVLVLALSHTPAMAAKPRTLLDSLVPAPPQFSIVYDNPKDAGGLDPATGQPYPAVGQYADINTNTVHTTRGYGKRLIAQDVGQIFGYNVLDSGQRHFFSHLLGTDSGHWENLHGANPEGTATGDEAFADYYAVAATGGLQPGEGILWGDVPIDRTKLKHFSSAIKRLGQRQHLAPLNLTAALASAR